MLLSAPPNPTAKKRITYLVVCVILGILLSLLVHAGIEALYLTWATSAGKAVVWYGGCALHPMLQFVLVLGGALSGFFLGRFWWRVVYVDRRWAKGKLAQ